MSNNYTLASFAIPVKDAELTRERMAILEVWFSEGVALEVAAGGSDRVRTLFGNDYLEWEESLADEREFGLGFAWSVDQQPSTDGETRHDLVISHDESINLETAITIARWMLDLDENDGVYTMEWASTCDKARVDEFGGGATAFSRSHEEWMNTTQLAAELVAKLEKKHGTK